MSGSIFAYETRPARRHAAVHLRRACATILAVLSLALVAGPAGLAQDDTAPPRAFPAVTLPPGTSRNDSVEEPATPLTPARTRSEAEEDRVRATALFARARVLLQQEKYAAALRHFQRAWRYDPQAVSILDDVLRAVGELRRNDEFARYAVIRAELEPLDALTMRRLGAYLTEEQNFARAVQMFERSLEAQDDKDADGTVTLVRLQMGRLYFLAGQLDQAAQSFALVRDALANPEKFGLDEESKKSVLAEADQTYLLFGECFLQAGRLDEAEAMFQKAGEAKKDKALLVVNLARVTARRDRTDEALQQLEQYLDYGSPVGGLEPYQLLADLLKKKLSDEGAAQRELRTRLQNHYDKKPNPALGYYLANLARETGELDRAAMLYEALVKEAPALDGFQALLDIYRRQGPVEKLLDALGAAVLKTATLEPLGDTTKQVSENTELMNKLFAAARSRQQAGAKSLGEGVPLALGMLAVAAKRYDEADEFYTLAAEAEAPPKAQVLLTWGLDMLMAEQYDRAARVFQRGIDEKVVGENNADFHFYLSGALGAGGKIDEAIAAAQQAAQIDPKSPRVLARVPWILYQAKRHAEAEKSYVELLARLDDDHSSSNVRATVREMRFILSNLCVLQERMPDAEEWLEQVLDEFPEDVGALNDLGYLWADQGEHLQRALAMIRRAVAAEPDNAAYRDSLGWVYYRLGRYDEAIKELEEAAKGDDPDGVILDHLGDAHLKAEHRDQAIATWQRAVTAFQKNDDAKSLEKTTAKIKQHSGE